MKSLWSDEDGAVISAELIVLMAVMIIGAVYGYSYLRDQIVDSLVNVSNELSNLQQDNLSTLNKVERRSVAKPHGIEVLTKHDYVQQ
jgi:hypothetical protein